MYVELQPIPLQSRHVLENLFPYYIYDIEQFFVLRKYKGHGVGTQALQKVVTHFPGNWQVRVMLDNKAGLGFWKSAIGQLSNDYQYSKSIDVDLTMHFFHFEAGRS
ncbi:GNAT family N-acetyltransferase [Vibrio profundi]|uniref:GNAT family N-acetyltransferase n=1 Tax=Vibrio profundi TaxID=1774960 RepID=UPI00373684C6